MKYESTPGEFKCARCSRNISCDYVVVDYACKMRIGYSRAIYYCCRGLSMYFIKWLVRLVDVYYLYFYGLACCKCDLTSIDLAIISYRQRKYYCMRKIPGVRHRSCPRHRSLLYPINFIILLLCSCLTLHSNVRSSSSSSSSY